MIPRLLDFAGLAAALVGAVYLVRGAWEDAAGCFMALIVASFRPLWSIGRDPPLA